MGKEDVLTLLRKVDFHGDIPSGLDYDIDSSTKNLTLKVLSKGLKANMQNDEAAFDSWGIALKYYLNKVIDTITIDWELDFCKRGPGFYHYNRFIYRLSKFVETYPWARSAKPIPEVPESLVCNVPDQEASNPSSSSSKSSPDSEYGLECKYVETHSDDYDAIGHQLPVGLFEGKVSCGTNYTPGGRSAIDIWAINGDCLSVFELKKTGDTNKPLGIISKLMFIQMLCTIL